MSYDITSDQYANQQLKTLYSHLDKLQEVYNTATKNTEENHQYVQYLLKEIKKNIYCGKKWQQHTTKNHLGYILYILDFLGDKEITSGSISNILTQ
jgi:hypothetical protein